MKVKLSPAHGLLDFGLTLRRYRAYGEDAANWFDGHTFRKVLDAGGELYLMSISQQGEDVVLEIEPDPVSPPVCARAEMTCRALLGLDFPLHEFYAFAADDPVLVRLARQYPGYRPTLMPDLFETLVTAITAQQINLRFAFTVRSRIIRRFGKAYPAHERRYFAFPSAEDLAQANVEQLFALQLTRRKSEYILGLARAVRDGRLDLEGLRHRPDAEIFATLTAMRGIGRWSVDWLLARGLGRGHAIAAGDLGVKRAVEKYYFAGEMQTEAAIRELAARWGDFANLAAHYLLLGYVLEG